MEQNPDLPRCVASLTKMMTALLVLESGTDLNASITIPASLTPELQSIRANRGHTIGLQAGETVRRIDMMYAMLLPSANDAASVLARRYLRQSGRLRGSDERPGQPAGL
ncbi:MAG: hypothetical protein ACLRRU_03190 [Faecalibacterium sp.]